MFEQYPYADLQQLNLDWIIKIAKDFLDQYTHIQDLINNGMAQLDEKTEQDLASLNAEYQRLNGLLDSWYETHSQDIANELSAALTDFAAQAGAIVNSVIQTIPQDYTEMGKSVFNNKLLSQEAFSILNGRPYNPVFNIGYSINAQGEYFLAYGLETKRAATEIYSETNKSFKIEVNDDDTTFNVLYYSDTNEASFVSSAGGPFSGNHIFTNPYSKYYRVVLMNDSGIPSNINSLVTVTNYTDVSELLNITSSPANCYYPVPFTVEFGAITPGLSINTGVGEHTSITVKPGEKYLIDGYTYVVDTYPVCFFRDNYGVISTISTGSGKIRNLEVTVPTGAVFMYVNARPTAPYDMAIFKKIDTVKDMANVSYSAQERFNGKDIVWYGTSIPANGFLGSDHPEAYPQQVGKLLGANVINKAVGSSCIYCKDPSRINTNNPYGFLPNFESASRCLTNSIEEMEWICDHYNSNIWTTGRVTEMTPALRDQIKSFSYENMILPYLTAQTEPFLFVFDHCFNDSPDTNGYYATYGRYNLYTYRGGMNFLLEKIFSFDPFANVLMIGNYDNRADKYGMQLEVTNDWAIPIIKQWEYLKFSVTEYVNPYGYWQQNGNDYTWITDTVTHNMTLKDRLVPDHIHPWSDPTGNNVRLMTQGIYRAILGIAFK